MTLQEIADDIKGKRSLSDIDEVFLKSRILERVETYRIDINEEFKKLKRKERYKEFFKDTRKTLRKVYGVYREIKEKRNKKTYEQLYEKIGNFDSVLDIGCGLSPLEYIEIFGKDKTYYLTDISKENIKEIQKYMKKNKVKGKTFLFNALDNYNEKLPKTDVIFLFKMLESLETIEKDSSERLFKQLKAKVILVSFSKIALSKGEGIKKKGRSWFRRMLSKNGYSFGDFDLEDEIFFLIK